MAPFGSLVVAWLSSRIGAETRSLSAVRVVLRALWFASALPVIREECALFTSDWASFRKWPWVLAQAHGSLRCPRTRLTTPHSDRRDLGICLAPGIGRYGDNAVVPSRKAGGAVVTGSPAHSTFCFCRHRRDALSHAKLLGSLTAKGTASAGGAGLRNIRLKRPPKTRR